MTFGVRVHGATVTDVAVSSKGFWQTVPVSVLCGVSILWKKMSGTGGSVAHIKNNIIVRFMVEPEDALAPAHWQYGGGMGPAPPVVLIRKDGLPFSRQDWNALYTYINTWMDKCMGTEENKHSVNTSFLTLSNFTEYVKQNREAWPAAFLSLMFPLRCIVAPSGLSTEMLNGVEGEVMQFSRNRVGVRFINYSEPVALKPERLTLVREAPSIEIPRQRVIDMAEKDARTKLLAERDALVIAKRFIDCLHADTFPEMGDLHLFGVGCEYAQRATEVLAVWQGSLKHGNLEAEVLAQALMTDNVRAMFEELAYKLANSRTPNSTYAKQLITANFSATEWDTL